jgi:hypothetical protein
MKGSSSCSDGGERGGVADAAARNVRENPWLKWAAFIVPGFATALTWPATEGWPLLNRIAVSIAVGLVIFAAVYLVAKAGDRNGR